MKQKGKRWEISLLVSLVCIIAVIGFVSGCGQQAPTPTPTPVPSPTPTPTPPPAQEAINFKVEMMTASTGGSGAANSLYTQMLESVSNHQLAFENFWMIAAYKEQILGVG